MLRAPSMAASSCASVGSCRFSMTLTRCKLRS
jgi:hypothetical protein